MTSLDAMLASLERARLNREAKSKNPNVEAEGSRVVTDNTVTKSNALARAYYRFNLIEKRVMEALISKIHPQRLDNPQTLELSALEYAKAYDVSNSMSYRDISKATTGLATTTLTLERAGGKKGKIEIPLMAIAEHMEDEGRIQCRFNSEFLPHLMQLSGKFSSYPLKQAANFTSSYTWRFYELLVSWAQPRNETEGKFMGWIDKQSVDELRLMLGVPATYSWAKFEQQVLNTATSELQEKAGIAVFIERVKTSRKITHLNIKFIEVPKTGDSNKAEKPRRIRKKAA